MSITKEDILKLIEENEFDLQPTQDRICVPIVNRIYKKMRIGIKFDGINVCDGFIINGHHRYIASLLSNFDLQRNEWEKPSEPKTINWEEVEIIDEDWDSKAGIAEFNKRDAHYNELTLESLLELIKNA